uniref:Sulfate transport system permease protein CysT n=1 Tax=Pseudochloris wilhelmii TaxID=1418016 RepID=A0A097KQP2_9CHLO|nr:probable transport protein [Pseudochloris wilhelmii]AIT95487.1 probable transport protein [Pseudochloris wilhelmii]
MWRRFSLDIKKFKAIKKFHWFKYFIEFLFIRKNTAIRVGLASYVFVLLVLPLSTLGFILSKSNWSYILEKAFDPVAISAYKLTFGLSFFAAILNTIFGFIITWVLTRYNFIGKKYLDAAVDVPFALPTSVAGLTLITIYGKQGILGRVFHLFGIEIVFTKIGVLLAMIFVSFPFVIRTLQPVIQELDITLEEAAWSLGASSWETFLRILVPNVWPAVLTGFTLSFSRALGEFGSVVMIASNIPFRDVVTSVLIYQSIEQYDYIGAAVIGTVMLITAFIIIVSINIVQANYLKN